MPSPLARTTRNSVTRPPSVRPVRGYVVSTPHPGACPGTPGRRRSTAGAQHELVEERLLGRIAVGRVLRMPLHRDDPAAPGGLEGLDQAVRAASRDPQALAD